MIEHKCGKEGTAMDFDVKRQREFFSEMSERQLSAREFFGSRLLDSLERNYGIKNSLIMCFDTENGFLSWTDESGVLEAGEWHPYSRLAGRDAVRKRVYREAVSERLDYFNLEPKLYRSSDCICGEGYWEADYVKFIEEEFHAAYSVTMAFGINAYIQIVIFRSAEEGDFSDEEMEKLKDIYVSIANAYKGFKKYEQSRIVSSIQDEIIMSGEKAYFITDDFMHILSCNSLAAGYIENILGSGAAESLKEGEPCLWLPFLLEGAEKTGEADVKTVRGYVFSIYTYDREYSHGIVDRYHWVTVYPKGEATDEAPWDAFSLTEREKKVASMLMEGLTYKEIAGRLFISYHTVKKHVESIYAKCGVGSRHELYRRVRKNMCE